MRAYCQHCGYPLSTCVCTAIAPVPCPVGLTILQHPKERDHAKNTARLVTLCIESTSVVMTDDAEAMAALAKNLDPKSSMLLYPSQTSVALEALPATTINQLTNIVVIDGSWRQAFAIYQQHAWLQQLASCHFNRAEATAYTIRHTQQSCGLSTLEAVAYTLRCAFDIDTSALNGLQTAMIEHWRGPLSHRR